MMVQKRHLEQDAKENGQECTDLLTDINGTMNLRVGCKPMDRQHPAPGRIDECQKTAISSVQFSRSVVFNSL